MINRLKLEIESFTAKKKLWNILKSHKILEEILENIEYPQQTISILIYALPTFYWIVK